MYIYIYIYTYICIYIYIHVHIYTCMYKFYEIYCVYAFESFIIVHWYILNITNVIRLKLLHVGFSAVRDCYEAYALLIAILEDGEGLQGIVYICIWIYMYMFMYSYVYTFICVYIDTYIYIHIYIYIYTCIYIYIYVHIYTYRDD
jgi:hypothetical protein